MNNQDKILRDFCASHKIRIIDTNKKSYIHKKINVDYFKYPNDFNMIDTHVVHETEPLYTVEITKSELEYMADFENQVFNNMRENGHYNMFNYIMEQKEQEKKLKDRYPAVKKAYEHYSLMLKMAQGGEL